MTTEPDAASAAPWRRVGVVIVLVVAMLLMRLASSESPRPPPTTYRPVVTVMEDTDVPTTRLLTPRPAALRVTVTPLAPLTGTPALLDWKLPRPSNNCAADTVLRLFTPTFITWISGWWFVVDCWHHRVIFSDSLQRDVSTWADLTASDAKDAHRDMIIPHSIATDGRGLLVVESSVDGSSGTDHSLLVYFMKQPGAVPIFRQEVVLCKGNTARRPHRVEFDAEVGSFFVYLTNPPSLAEVPVPTTTERWWSTPPTLSASRCVPLPYMKGVYARSFAVVDSKLHITAGPGVISVVNHALPAVPLVSAHSVKPLGFGKGRMNDLQRIGSWWYATSTAPCAFLRFKDLKTMRPVEHLAGKLGLCQNFDRRAERCLGGTPYFVSRPNTSDGRIYVPYIFGCSGVVSFLIDEAEGAPPRDVTQHWGKGWVERKTDTDCWGAK